MRRNGGPVILIILNALGRNLRGVVIATIIINYGAKHIRIIFMSMKSLIESREENICVNICEDIVK